MCGGRSSRARLPVKTPHPKSAPRVVHNSRSHDLVYWNGRWAIMKNFDNGSSKQTKLIGLVVAYSSTCGTLSLACSLCSELHFHQTFFMALRPLRSNHGSRQRTSCRFESHKLIRILQLSRSEGLLLWSLWTMSVADAKQCMIRGLLVVCLRLRHIRIPGIGVRNWPGRDTCNTLHLISSCVIKVTFETSGIAASCLMVQRVFSKARKRCFVDWRKIQCWSRLGESRMEVYWSSSVSGLVWQATGERLVCSSSRRTRINQRRAVEWCHDLWGFEVVKGRTPWEGYHFPLFLFPATQSM